MSVTFGGYIEDPSAKYGLRSVSLGDDDHGLNFNNANALALLSLLKLTEGQRPGEDDLCGAVTLAVARRAVMYARATFARRAQAFTRQEEQGEGTQGARFVSCGLDVDGLSRRLEAFAAHVEALAQAGASHISWG
jgi:hypothetical protein